MIEIVGATRMAKDDFWARSALGRSLVRLESDERWVPRIAFENRRGLPEVYNERIDIDTEHDVLVFLHDDVWLDDAFFGERLLAGLERFDVIGVAGNKRRVPRQVGWKLLDEAPTEDALSNLSGTVCHGKEPCGTLSYFGPAPAAVELLDGVLIAARRSTLRRCGLRFDPSFRFHFYDLDFCRSARARELELGTWPISITHQSEGHFGTPDWFAGLGTYRAKWPE
jgi:GT2 family glycosyltransferase